MLAIKRKAKGKPEESEKKSRNIFATFSSPEPLGLICKWLRNGGLRGLTFFFSIFALPMADGKNGKGLKKLFYWFCFSDGTPGWNICTTVLARLSDCGVCLITTRCLGNEPTQKNVRSKNSQASSLFSFPFMPLILLFYFILFHILRIFSWSLISHRTPLSERLEHATPFP